MLNLTASQWLVDVFPVRVLRVTGAARAEAFRAGAEALGAPAFAALKVMQVVGERQVRIVPDVSVSGDGGAPAWSSAAAK